MSSIYLTDSELVATGSGTAITLDNFGSVGTVSVGSNNYAETPLLSISNYNQLTENVLLNGDFATGDLTDWDSEGTVNVIEGTYAGIQFVSQIQNLSAISQTIETGFEGKNPVLTFSHYGFEAYVSVELLDISNVLVGSKNVIFPSNFDNWIPCKVGLYSGLATAVKCRIRIYSDNDNCQVTKVRLLSCDNYAELTVGDVYNDSRNTFAFYGGKLFLGDASELISTRPEGADFRTSLFVQGDINCNGNINANIGYSQIGLQPFATNMLISSGNSTNISWSSAILQLLSTQSFGISSGSQTISNLTYFYLDTDLSESVLQYSELYTDALGNNKVIVFSATPTTGEKATWQSFSGISPVATKVSDLASSLGSLTLSGASSYISIGTTPPVSSISGSGLWIDESGVYSLLSNVQQATLNQNGLAAGNNVVKMDSGGFSIYPSGTFSINSLKWYDGSNNIIAGIFGRETGAPSVIAVSNGGTLDLICEHIRIAPVTDLIINENANSFFLRIEGSTEQNLFYLDGPNNNIGLGTNTPNVNSILDLTSTTKTFLPPRMSTTQRDAISSPTSGMVIYNSTTNKLNVYGASLWEQITST